MLQRLAQLRTSAGLWVDLSRVRYVPFLVAPLSLPLAKGTSSSDELIATSTEGNASKRGRLMGLMNAICHPRSRRVMKKCPFEITGGAEGKCLSRCRRRSE